MGVQNVQLTDKGFESTAFIIAGIFILIFLGEFNLFVLIEMKVFVLVLVFVVYKLVTSQLEKKRKKASENQNRQKPLLELLNTPWKSRM